MKALVFFLVFIGCSGLVAAESAYVITLGYTDNELLFSGITIKNVPLQQPSLITGYYVLEQLNFAGSISQKNSFQPAVGTFTVATPYQSDTREIIIRNPQDEIVLSVPVLQFADTCNNNICEPQESYETCSQDCPSGTDDGYCDEVRDGICDHDCAGKLDEDCKEAQAFEVPQRKKAIENKPTASVQEQETSNIHFIMIIAIGLIVILLLGIVGVALHTKKVHRIKQLKDYVAQTVSQGYSVQQVQEALLSNGYSEEEIVEVINQKE